MSTLFKFLPPAWWVDTLASGLVRAMGAPLDRWRIAVATAYRYVDADACPEAQLDWLMQRVGLPRRDGLTPTQKRALIKVAQQVWDQKGRRDAIELYARAIAGVTTEVVNLNTAHCVAGLAVAGDICGPGALAWRYEVRVPVGYVDVTTLRDLLAYVAPSLGRYRIVDLDGAVLSDFPS